MFAKEMSTLLDLIQNLAINHHEKQQLLDKIALINQKCDQEMKSIFSNLKYTRELIEVSQDPLVTINPKGMITDVNRACEEAIGLTRDKLIGTSLAKYFTNPNQAKESFQQAFSQGRINNYSLELKHANGEVIPVLYNGSMYKDEHEQLVGLFIDMRDISVSKKYQEELEQIQQNLQKMVIDRTKELNTTQMLLKSSLESPRHMLILAIDKNYRYLYYNRTHRLAMKRSYGCDVSLGVNLLEKITISSDRIKAKKHYDLAMQGTPHTTIEQFGLNPTHYFESSYNPIYDEKEQIIGASAFAWDVTDRIITHNKLKESEARLEMFFKQSLTGFFIMTIDKPIVWNDNIDKKAALDYVFKNSRCSRVNQAILNQYGSKEEDYLRLTPQDMFAHDLDKGKEFWHQLFDKGYLHVTTEERKHDGSVMMVEGDYICMYDERGRIIGHFGNQHDVTEQIKKQNEVAYLSNHDYLTNLYNRRYYFTQFYELDKFMYYPLGIMILDVNGLKIINDAYGHNAGDAALTKIGDIICGIFEKKDIVARIGGDEFAVLLPKTTPEQMQAYKELIVSQVKLQKVNNIELSLSVGYEIKNNIHEEIDDIMKGAENQMYRHKTTEGASVRNRAITAILKTLTDKYVGEFNHSQRVSLLSRKIGEALKLKADDIKELEQAGMFHDIGKISIPDVILNKPDKLTSDEYKTIKTHTEIGYQILRAADEYSDLAIHALHHHERWDGNGYPKGLKGKDIPLFSRIIGVVDAYEAMTANRPYRNKISDEAALNEILRCSGTQFDPRIVKVFVEKVLKEEKI